MVGSILLSAASTDKDAKIHTIYKYMEIYVYYLEARYA